LAKDIWPPIFYATWDIEWNPVRDIMKLPPGTTPENYFITDRRKYFARMSQAFALLCSEKVTVMTKDVDKIPYQGIWYQTELPTLIREVPRGQPRVDMVK
jgi:hypothetical protein